MNSQMKRCKVSENPEGSSFCPGGAGCTPFPSGFVHSPQSALYCLLLGFYGGVFM